ncbi:MAG: MBL fold metallo-hydrolase [Clostridia bacterium]|nr:MBL fold metallo-hydrolase [Clostridia bacterium]
MRKNKLAFFCSLLTSMLFSGCSLMMGTGESTGAGTHSNPFSSQSEKEPSNILDDTANGEGKVEEIVSGDLSIHFLELGNKYTGDCTLIKVGNTEVLIDAGSRKGSAPTVSAYIDEYCTDGVLEYVISTHAHEDHISGFIGTKNGNTRSGILYNYEVETLIQFARSDYGLTTENGNPTLYSEYLDAVAYAETQGTQVYTALECWNGTNGAQKTYYLDAENKVSMNILYNYFYENKTSGGGGENEYSVCMLLSYEEEHFLFTGDLEKKGEEYLVQYNELPQCTLFKGGHHGSYTASSETLLSVIQPEIVCVCCCCGSTEYTKDMANVFPSQAFVDRVAKYTDRVYVTTVVSEDAKGYQSMNGNIVVWMREDTISINCSNNNILFKDTEWFAVNRIMPEPWKTSGE